MTTGRPDDAQDVNTWVNLVRRARLGRQTKLVALLCASYADPDGSSVRPGVARLSWAAGIAYSTAKKELALLRKVGLLTKVGKYGYADVYQLTFGAQLLDHITVPSPTEEEAALKEIRDRERGHHVPSHRRGKGAHAASAGTGRPHLRLVRTAADDVEDADLRLHTVAADFVEPVDNSDLRLPQEDRRSGGAQKSAATQDSRKNESAAISEKSAATSCELLPTTDPPTYITLHSDQASPTDVTTVRAHDSGQDPQPEESAATESAATARADIRSLVAAARNRPPRHRADGLGLLDRALDALGIPTTPPRTDPA